MRSQMSIMPKKCFFLFLKKSLLCIRPGIDLVSKRSYSLANYLNRILFLFRFGIEYSYSELKFCMKVKILLFTCYYV
jgi:hypothetical protein